MGVLPLMPPPSQRFYTLEKKKFRFSEKKEKMSDAVKRKSEKKKMGERDMMFLPEQDPKDMEMLWGLEYMERFESKWGVQPR